MKNRLEIYENGAWRPVKVSQMERLERSVWRAIDALEAAQDGFGDILDMVAIFVLVFLYVVLLATVIAWGMS